MSPEGCLACGGAGCGLCRHRVEVAVAEPSTHGDCSVLREPSTHGDYSVLRKASQEDVESALLSDVSQDLPSPTSSPLEQGVTPRTIARQDDSAVGPAARCGRAPFAAAVAGATLCGCLVLGAVAVRQVSPGLAGAEATQGLSERSAMDSLAGRVWKSFGNDTVCALDPSDPQAMRGASLKRVRSSSREDCKQRCQAEGHCSGVEYTKGSCGLWLQPVTSVESMQGSECSVLVKSGHFTRHESSTCHPSSSKSEPVAVHEFKDLGEEQCQTMCQAVLGTGCVAVEHSSKTRQCKMWSEHVGAHDSHDKDSSCFFFARSLIDASSLDQGIAGESDRSPSGPCNTPLCSVGSTWESWGLDKVFPWAADSSTTTATKTTTTTTSTSTTTTTKTTTSEKASTTEGTSTTHTVTTTEAYCRTASRTEDCYKHVTWVRTEGISLHPDWYPNLTKHSTFEDVQWNLNKSVPDANCSVPCTSPSLFCFLVVTEDGVSREADPVRPGYEVQLVDKQRSVGAGVFSCDSSAVYHGKKAKVGDWGSLANVESFMKVWQDVQEDGHYRSRDWTVKVDADTVFFAHRLRQHLWELSVPLDRPLYIKNTDFAFGFMGALEVMNKAAVDVLVKHQGACYDDMGDMGGEDHFVHDCLGGHGVDHVDDVTLLSDKYALLEGSWQWFDITPCANATPVAFHPFKAVDAWMGCQAVALELENLSSFPTCDAAASAYVACRALPGSAPEASQKAKPHLS